MKQIILPLIIFASLPVLAAERGDTILNINNPQTITITETPGWVNVNVKTDTLGSEVSFFEEFKTPVRIEARRGLHELSIVRSNDDRWDLLAGGPGIGWINSCGQPDGLGLEMSKSLEVSWTCALAVGYRLPWKSGQISLGIGFDWRNYRISTSQTCFMPTRDNAVAVTGYQEGATGRGSRLKVFSLGFPLLYRHRFPVRFLGDGLSVKFGAIFNINPHGSLKTKWVDAEGNNVVAKSNEIGQRKFTVDIFGALHIKGGLHLYVRYSPQSVLKTGPSFTPFSTGLILGL